MADIIESVMTGGGGRPSKIMLDANLSYERMSKYLSVLTEKGLLELTGSGGLYVATPKGVEFLEEFKKFERLAKTFGLEL